MTMPMHSKKRYYLGIAALFLVVCIWVTTSFITNNIFGEQEYERPFFVTYYSTSTFTLYLIPFLICHGRTTETVMTERLLAEEEENEEGYKETTIEKEKDGTKDGTLTLTETFRVSASFCLLWFIANYCTNASLVYTTVGSSTILSSTTGLFTLVFGVLLKVEKFHWIKMISVGVSLFGVVLVSWSDQQTVMQRNKLVGDLFALTGAVFYGGYTILLKLCIGNESRIVMPTFFGFVGFINVLVLWPVFFILDWTGVEPFSFPSHSTLWILISVNAFIGTFLSDYLWLVSMLMTSPLVVTLGITLTVPMALIGDIIIKHIFPGVQYLLGAALVVAGFFLVNLDSLQDDRDQDETMEMIPCDESSQHT